MKKITMVAVVVVLFLVGEAQASSEGVAYINAYFTQLTQRALQCCADYPSPSTIKLAVLSGWRWLQTKVR